MKNTKNQIMSHKTCPVPNVAASMPTLLFRDDGSIGGAFAARVIRGPPYCQPLTGARPLRAAESYDGRAARRRAARPGSSIAPVDRAAWSDRSRGEAHELDPRAVRIGQVAEVEALIALAERRSGGVQHARTERLQQRCGLVDVVDSKAEVGEAQLVHRASLGRADQVRLVEVQELDPLATASQHLRLDPAALELDEAAELITDLVACAQLEAEPLAVEAARGAPNRRRRCRDGRIGRSPGRARRCCECRRHLGGDEAQVVEVDEVEHLEVDASGTGFGEGRGALDDLGRRAGEAVPAQRHEIPTDRRCPPLEGRLVLATADDERHRSPDGRRIPPDGPAGVVDGGIDRATSDRRKRTAH